MHADTYMSALGDGAVEIYMISQWFACLIISLSLAVQHIERTEYY